MPLYMYFMHNIYSLSYSEHMKYVILIIMITSIMCYCRMVVNFCFAFLLYSTRSFIIDLYLRSRLCFRAINTELLLPIHYSPITVLLCKMYIIKFARIETCLMCARADCEDPPIIKNRSNPPGAAHDAYRHSSNKT